MLSDAIGERTFAVTMVARAERVVAEPPQPIDSADLVRQCFSARAGAATVVESDWLLAARDASGALVGLASPYANCVELDPSAGPITVTARAADDETLVASVTLGAP